jgi:predicted alpha/beta superfamily hydrolase
VGLLADRSRQTGFETSSSGREYVEFVTREVMPFVARTYPVLRGASNTGIGGSSYGAAAALFAALVKPGCSAGCCSRVRRGMWAVGTCWSARGARRAERWPGRIYLGVGTAETRRRDCNEETVDNVRTLAAILRRARFGPRRLLTRVEANAAHTESAWAARFPEALTFLYRRR